MKRSKYNEDPYEYGISRGYKNATRELRAEVSTWKMQRGMDRLVNSSASSQELQKQQIVEALDEDSWQAGYC